MKKVESDLIKLAKDSEICRHEVISSAYLVEKLHILPLHNCCDICETKCDCKTDNCPNTHKAFLDLEETESEEEIERPVSDTERKLLRHKLLSYKYSLTDEAGLSIMEVNIIRGLDDTVIDSIVKMSSMLFTPDDIMKLFPIWS